MAPLLWHIMGHAKKNMIKTILVPLMLQRPLNSSLQVFAANWHGEAIAVKLVPFMSLIAAGQHQHHFHNVTSVTSSVTGQQNPSDYPPVTPPLLTPAPASGNADNGDGSVRTDGAAGSGGGGGARVLLQQQQQQQQQQQLVAGGPGFSMAALKAIQQEIKVLSQLQHPHIIAFKGACLAPPHICILEELAVGGSLHTRLYSRGSSGSSKKASGSSSSSSSQGKSRGVRGGSSSGLRRGSSSSNGGGSGSSRQPAPPLEEVELLQIAVDVATAMCYLHPKVVHRDLKPQNVLLDERGRAKVSWGEMAGRGGRGGDLYIARGVATLELGVNIWGVPHCMYMGGTTLQETVSLCFYVSSDTE